MILAVSCNHSDDPQPASGQDTVRRDSLNTALLIGKRWVNTEWRINPAFTTSDGWVIEDLYAITRDCDRDNFYLFTPTRYTLDEGLTICDNTGPQVISEGNWRWTNHGTAIVFSGDDEPNLEVWTIDTLAANLLQAHYTRIFTVDDTTFLGNFNATYRPR